MKIFYKQRDAASVGMVVSVFFLALTFSVSAQGSPFDIQFPILELGSCGSREECKRFCDEPANSDTCIAWAETNGFRGKGTDRRGDVRDDAAEALLQTQTGPGGCTSPATCDVYCSDQTHHDECFAFAREHGLLSKGEIERVKNRGTRNIVGPGGCRSHNECSAFCEGPENAELCIDFAVRNGHMSEEDAARLRERISFRPPGRDVSRPSGPRIDRPEGPEIDEERVRELLQTQAGPGGCTSFETCDAFCSTPSNEEECFDYAVRNELIPAGETERFRALMNTKGPGGCRGRECEEYCEAPGREEECLNFAIDNGLIPPEKVEHARRFLEIARDGGPGGCRGRECEEYCENPTHRDECFTFAKEHQLIPPEELERTERLQTRMRSAGGPGGCRNEVECREYCSDPLHIDECSAFAADVGLLPPEQARKMLQDSVDVEHHIPDNFDRGQFEPPRDFDGSGFGSQFDTTAPNFGDTSPGVRSSLIHLKQEPDRSFSLFIQDSDGIRKFELVDVVGSRYGGNLACQREYRATRVGVRTFPVKARFTDCAGNEVHRTITADEARNVSSSEPMPSTSSYFPPSDNSRVDQDPSRGSFIEGDNLPNSSFRDQHSGQSGQEYQREFERQYLEQYELQQQQQFEQQILEGSVDGTLPDPGPDGILPLLEVPSPDVVGGSPMLFRGMANVMNAFLNLFR